jgi:hypothetical protein
MDYQLKPFPVSAPETKATENPTADLTLAFDVGHSSIGWAVLQSPPPAPSKSNKSTPTPQILGTGVVTFPADDCLASKRRSYRRQRRHVRSTRQRIQRMEKLLIHLGVFTEDQIKAKHTQGGGHAAPWLLAGRVLASNGAPEHLLNWDQLWDVLRWYAHNRGYDGNRRWAGNAATSADEDDETEKVENARALMQQYHTCTMADTITAIMYEPHGKTRALDITKDASLPFFTGKSRYKAKNAAFPREIVEQEVRTLLTHHRDKLPQLTESFVSLLLDQTDREEDKAILIAANICLPKRFDGGLLFGQFIPRFDNRIITTCPISGGKVPAKASKEFRLYRWLMQLANVRVVREGQSALNAEERAAVHQQMLATGYFTPGQFKDIVRKVTGTKADNLDTMLMHPDADKALVLDPVKKLIASNQVQYLWPHLPEQVRKRAAGKWAKGKPLTLQQLLDWSPEFGLSAEAILSDAGAATVGSINKSQLRNKKKAIVTPSLTVALQTEPLSGRAPFHRDILSKACEEVLAGFDPRKKSIANDPVGGEDKSADGILVRDILTNVAPPPFPDFERWHRRWAKRRRNQGKSLTKAQQEYAEAKHQSLHDSRTNNHLVRHRLLILQRLVADLIADPSLLNGDATRVKAVAIEVNSELKELSGKTAKQVAQDIGLRLGNFKSVVKKLQDAGIQHPSAGLIRKARVAEDLNWTCPYTGQKFDAQDLLHPELWDKDHIIPYSQRPSNSLDSLVITRKAVNNLKTNRTALEFIEWINQPENLALRNQHQIWTPKQYKEFVEGLEAWRGHEDDKRRKRRRRQLLLLPKWEDKNAGFLPRDLTVTSQLTRLAALALHRQLPHLKPHEITSIPGSVTGTVRNAWKLLGTLQAANPGVIDPQTGELKNKTEIREVTHLHHALDAVVLGLTHHYFPKNGRLWEAMVRREKQRTLEDNQLLLKTGLYVPSQSENKSIVLFTRELPPQIEEQLRATLAERRVVQHVPADMSGMLVEENTRGLERIDENDIAHLKQISRDPKTGKLVTKRTKESLAKLIGLKPGKLKDQTGVRVISGNYGVAILDTPPSKPDGSPGEEEDRFIIIPFAGVRKRLKALASLNNGAWPKILRAGQLIQVCGGKSHKGLWRIFSVKNNSNGKCVALGEADAINCRNDKQNVLLRQLIKDGLTIASSNLTGSVS